MIIKRIQFIQKMKLILNYMKQNIFIVNNFDRGHTVVMNRVYFWTKFSNFFIICVIFNLISIFFQTALNMTLQIIQSIIDIRT